MKLKIKAFLLTTLFLVLLVAVGFGISIGITYSAIIFGEKIAGIICLFILLPSVIFLFWSAYKDIKKVLRNDCYPKKD